MRLLEMLRGLNPWKRSESADADTRRILPRPERLAPRVPAEYLSLYSYLEHRYASSVVLTFQQMEALLGFPLPAPALAEPGWWARAAAARHTAAWTETGRTATPNLKAKVVVFERSA